jgi:hypothetical protein
MGIGDGKMERLTYTRNGTEFWNEFEVEEIDGSLVVNGLKIETVKYLLQYGWAQSLQDSIAGREKKVRDEFAAKVSAGEINEPAADEVNSAVAEDIEGQLGKRMDAILAGTVSTRSVGEPKDQLRAVANDMVRKALAAAKKKATKEQVKSLVDEILADGVRRAKVQAEFDRRKAETIEVDLI